MFFFGTSERIRGVWHHLFVRFAVLLAVFLIVGCGADARQASISVSPSTSVEDQPITIQVSGLRPRQHVDLSLASTDADGVRFTSRASFVADAQGRVDLTRTAPLSGGSYTTAWGSGLLASMTTAGSPLVYYSWGSKPRSFTVIATSSGKMLASTTFKRKWSARLYTSRTLTVARDGIDGTLFSPAGAKHRPAVLTFGGSEGGDNDKFASRFAAHGLPTLSVGYFDAPGLPNRLVNIPLEYFERALLWLRRQPEVNPNRITIFTGSYGSEAALLLGVKYPRLMHAIVATVPSAVVTCGIEGANRVTSSGAYCLGSPWTIDGKPLPYTKLLNDPSPWDKPQSEIPVWKIHVPLLLACAGADQVWASCPYARAIVARRRAHGEETTLDVYPQASHFVGSPFTAYDPGAMAKDVSTPWTELDRENLWPKVLGFVQGAHR